MPSNRFLTVPTVDEALRVKAFLVVRRNQTRDFVDVAALADAVGMERAAVVLAGIDEYYADQRGVGEGVATQLARQLAEPRPADSRATRELASYKRLDSRWHDWRAVVATCRELSDLMLTPPEDGG